MECPPAAPAEWRRGPAPGWRALVPSAPPPPALGTRTIVPSRRWPRSTGTARTVPTAVGPARRRGEMPGGRIQWRPAAACSGSGRRWRGAAGTPPASRPARRERPEAVGGGGGGPWLVPVRNRQPWNRLLPTADSSTSALDGRVRRVPVHGGDGAHRVGSPAGALVDAVELVLDVDEHEHRRVVHQLAHLLVLLHPLRRVQDAPPLPHHLAHGVGLLGVVDRFGADEQPLQVAVGVGGGRPLGGDDVVLTGEEAVEDGRTLGDLELGGDARLRELGGHRLGDLAVLEEHALGDLPLELEAAG